MPFVYRPLAGGDGCQSQSPHPSPLPAVALRLFSYRSIRDRVEGNLFSDSLDATGYAGPAQALAIRALSKASRSE